GGFGGGGGFNANGGFGGGGGGYGGNGGFGGGGGALAGAHGVGGFGGGNAGGASGFHSASGGGAGMGGAVFVVDGGTLEITGAGTLDASSVVGGPPGCCDVEGATAGQAFGAGVFLQGASGAIVFSPGAGATFAIGDAIADEAGSDPFASTNQRGITVGGDGTVVLYGTHAYAGPTTVTGATLELDGTLAGPVALSGGTLDGTGSAASLSASGGTIAPGTDAQPYATLHVDGDATLQGGSTLHLRADANSNDSSRLAIIGQATLGGEVVVDFDGGAPAVGSLYPLLAAATIVGTFDGVALPDGVAGRLVYEGGNVELEITDGAIDAIFTDGFDAPPRRSGAIVR
ncbi:MAG TPA: hypothetical protein VGC30_13430, partial [Dokdonella sp.]